MNASEKKNTGFTLLEMMIVVAILTVVFVMFYQTTLHTMHATEYVIAFNDLATGAQKASNQIREDLVTAKEIFQLFGPILHPWTFQIRSRGVEVGAIKKKWSGLATEAFTKADNFGVQFPPDADPQLKAVLLGAVFLIDFCHFEKGNNN